MKRICITMATVLTALGSQAVTLPFNTPAAPSWTKAAQCITSGGVNIRKAPSTSAPKLVYNENSLMDFDVPLVYSAYWGSKTGGAIQAVTFEGVAPVVSEQAGWIQLLNEGPKRKSNAWVSAKYCKVSEITPIKVQGNPRSCNFMIIDTPSNVEGTYGIYMNLQDMDGECVFLIGRLADGKMVCPYEYRCDYVVDASDLGFTTPFTKNEEGGYMRFTPTTDCMTMVMGEYGEYEAVDINKLPADMINQIVKLSKPIEGSPAIVYCCNGDYNLLWD